MRDFQRLIDSSNGQVKRMGLDLMWQEKKLFEHWRQHQAGKLNWEEFQEAVHPISTGPLEGTNNKIRAMTRQHYGLRDQEFLKLKLYQLHLTKYALVG